MPRFGGAWAQQALDEKATDIGAVIVGYGPVGQTVSRILRDFRIERW